MNWPDESMRFASICSGANTFFFVGNAALKQPRRLAPLQRNVIGGGTKTSFFLMFFWCRPDFEGVLAPPQINKRAVVISTNAQAICGGANGFLIAGFPQTPATFLQSQKKNNKKNRPLEFNALKKKQSISATARTDYGWLLFRFQKRRQLPNKKKKKKKPPPPKKKEKRAGSVTRYH